MMILIGKKQLLTALFLLAAIAAMGMILWAGSRPAVVQTLAVAAPAQARIFVIDPGHGGEDGGAVAADGTVESSINLAIASRVRTILCFCGEMTGMTRQDDRSIYTPGADTLRKKKVSDLKNRAALVNEMPGAILVSIHQNCMPAAPAVQGAQVFYNQGEGARELAKCVQQALNKTVNAPHGKTARPIAPTIYLMKHVTGPAVLLECGFLSNAEETARLKTPDYQIKLAAVIAGGLLSVSAGAEGEGP